MALLKEKQDIINWLENQQIKNYEVIPDKEYGYVINVDGAVNLDEKNLGSIVVKFNEIQGDFSCIRNKLTNLKFAPSVVKGSFNCSYNNLTSLKGCPKIIGQDFNCCFNRLTSLKFSPSTVNGSFYCGHNQLKTLEYCPQKVGGNFDCSRNQLTSLKFCPEVVNCHFNSSYNQLTSLEFCPEETKGNFNCNFNQINTLEFLPKTVKGTLYYKNNPELEKRYLNLENLYLEDIYRIHHEIVIRKQHEKLTEIIKENVKSEHKILKKKI